MRPIRFCDACGNFIQAHPWIRPTGVYCDNCNPRVESEEGRRLRADDPFSQWVLEKRFIDLEGVECNCPANGFPSRFGPHQDWCEGLKYARAHQHRRRSKFSDEDIASVFGQETSLGGSRAILLAMSDLKVGSHSDFTKHDQNRGFSVFRRSLGIIKVGRPNKPKPYSVPREPRVGPYKLLSKMLRLVELVPPGSLRPAANWTQPDKVRLLKDAFEAGMSLRKAELVAGVSHQTAVNWRKRLQIETPPCGCGKPATHNGWCSVRFANSPLRQNAMRDLHSRERSKFQASL